MKKTLALILALSAVLLVACSCGTANGNLSGSVFTEDGVGKYLTGCYLKVDAISGDVDLSRFDRWIEVIDFDFGTEHFEKNEPAEHKPLVIVHKVDSATPYFQSYCSTGMLLGGVKLEKTQIVSGAPLKTNFSIELTNARVLSAEITCDAQGNAVETVKLNYETATISYAPLRADGTLDNFITTTIDFRD